MRLAESAAASLLGEPMLLSWYDAARGVESPNGVSECHAAAPADGVRAYAASRGAALAVVFGGDERHATQFCFCDTA